MESYKIQRKIKSPEEEINIRQDVIKRLEDMASQNEEISPEVKKKIERLNQEISYYQKLNSENREIQTESTFKKVV